MMEYILTIKEIKININANKYIFCINRTLIHSRKTFKYQRIHAHVYMYSNTIYIHTVINSRYCSNYIDCTSQLVSI